MLLDDEEWCQDSIQEWCQWWKEDFTFSQVEKEAHNINIWHFNNSNSVQVNRINTGDNLTGSSTVLKLEWTEVRSGGSAHQLILKDNDNQAAGSQFQELGYVLC